EELRTKREIVEAIDSTLSGAKASDRESGRIYSLDDFVVGPCNRLAYAAALHVASGVDRSLNPLVVHGAVGLGKTHLVRGICTVWNRRGAAGALYLSAESFTNQFLASLQHNSLDGFRRKFEGIGLLALDDLQFLASKPATQDEFLQVYNFLTNLNKQVVLASDSHPKELERLRETLRTRLVSGMMVRLDAPDYETRLAILRRKLGTRDERVPDEVASFIAESVHGSVRELEGAATTLIAMARLGGEKIDLAAARRAVASLMPEGGHHVGVDAILDAVARVFHVTVADIQSTRRLKSIAFPRHVAMYLAREMTTMSWKEIGARFGRRNHTGALFAHKKIRTVLETDPALAERVTRLRLELGG
ncbi:MAG TPA: chromosomal replication initiator protein DnaA, partial [Planctomycetota bacterium]|nr:chromosomal replication initiator protein DnaA [Planctomycetota bacterium]